MFPIEPRTCSEDATRLGARYARVGFAFLLIQAAALGQEAVTRSSTDPVVAVRAAPEVTGRVDAKASLGAFLFGSKTLSATGRTSCATCHDPLRSFTDGRPDSQGEVDVGTGRNAPTLFGIGHVRLFRDPEQAGKASPGRKPDVLTLDQRCLAPLGNELEMNAGVKAVLAALKKDAEVAAKFEEAFGKGAAPDGPRLGAALAAYVATIEAPPSPYSRFLAGNPKALTTEQQRGEQIFSGRGNCVACHEGAALSDGRMWVVDSPKGQRFLDRGRSAAERRIELLKREYARKGPDAWRKLTAEQLRREATDQARKLPGRGGYDADQLEVQTTTLWDVARTAPYFRDGSVAKLPEAVATHVRELRQVWDERVAISKTVVDIRSKGKGGAEPLRYPRIVIDAGYGGVFGHKLIPTPPAAIAGGDSTLQFQSPFWVPPALDGAELGDLVAFLNAFSPS